MIKDITLTKEEIAIIMAELYQIKISLELRKDDLKVIEKLKVIRKILGQ